MIGAELASEPGQATWGDGNTQTDWQQAATAIGQTVQSINPNWLLFVDGIGSKSLASNTPTNYGENLEQAGAHPVSLPNVVYSPHIYSADALFGPDAGANSLIPDNTEYANLDAIFG